MKMKVFLVFVVLVGLGAVAGAVVVGVMSFDGTVVENTYERGISWDAERKGREASGIRVRIIGADFPRGDGTLVFMALEDSGEPVAEEKLEVRIFRAASDQHDRTYTAFRRGDDTFAADVSLPLPGRWEVSILLERQGAIMEFPAAIHAGAPP